MSIIDDRLAVDELLNDIRAAVENGLYAWSWLDELHRDLLKSIDGSQFDTVRYALEYDAARCQCIISDYLTVIKKALEKAGY